MEQMELGDYETFSSDVDVHEEFERLLWSWGLNDPSPADLGDLQVLAYRWAGNDLERLREVGIHLETLEAIFAQDRFFNDVDDEDLGRVF